MKGYYKMYMNGYKKLYQYFLCLKMWVAIIHF